jgi:mannosyltransferase OCH1-like enzyme
MFPETSFYQSFIWAHDIELFNYGCDLDVKNILNKWSTKINGCVCQTEWHKNLFLQQYPELENKIFTINNGILIDKFTCKPIKFTNRFIYTSCAERGLDRVLELWPKIIDVLPDAELFICSYNTFPINDYEKKLDAIIQKHESIKHLGCLNKNKLYELMSCSEFWLYPTNFSETSCITAMEMLMSEVICIYYPVAGLVDTLGEYGIPIQREQEISSILNLSTKQKYEIRKKGREYALSCCWTNRANKWMKLLNLNNETNNNETNNNETNNNDKKNIELIIDEIDNNDKNIDDKKINIKKYNDFSVMVSYGSKDIDVNVTEYVFKNLINNGCIIIQKNDDYRASLFGDPIFGVRKSIFIKDNSGIVLKEFKDDEDVNYLLQKKYDMNHIKITNSQNKNQNQQELVTTEYIEKNCLTKGEKILHNKIAIFNSFDFHYEMFGFIIKYCEGHNYNLTIYTETKNDLGYINFYKEHFNEYPIFKTCLEYEKEKDLYDITIITTDDEPNYKEEWINNKTICIEHFYKIRQPKIKNRIATRPFSSNYRHWILPCYELISSQEKCMVLHNDNNIHIATHQNISEKDILLINNIYTAINKPLIIYVLKRNIIRINTMLLNNNIIIKYYASLETRDYINIIKKCNYYLVDLDENHDHRLGYSSTGGITMAFNTLTPLIMSSLNNTFYKFKNVMTFDVETNNILYKHISIDNLEKERMELIKTFNLYMNCQIDQKIPKNIYQTWETKNIEPEFQQIIDLWKINNPDYEYHLYDSIDRINFIKHNFNDEIYNVYNKIIPGAYKTDFWRYCLLYKLGGIYADIDVLSIGKIDTFVSDNIKFIAPIDLNINHHEGIHNISNGFIGVTPYSDIMLKCIHLIVNNVNNNYIPPSKLDFSGPGILGRAVNSYLNLPETNSFAGKEGIDICNNFHLLKFHRETEYMTDLNNNVLLQNKNKNDNIIKLYNIECKKIKHFVSWSHCSNNEIININPVKHIVLMIYGQFSTFENNLEYNIKMLEPLFKDNYVHAFILSDKSKGSNFSNENEEKIKDIFKKYHFNIHIFDYIDNYNADEENIVYNNFMKTIKNKDGVQNNFVSRLIYRKYFLNKLTTIFLKENNIKSDIFVFCRLFDIKINNNLSFDIIEQQINKLYSNSNIIFGSSDTFFIGSQETIEYIFSLALFYKESKIYHDDIWNSDFINFLSTMNICLCNNRATYAPEVQYIYHVYNSDYTYKNIRFDFNNTDSTHNRISLYNIILDPERKIIY